MSGKSVTGIISLLFGLVLLYLFFLGYFVVVPRLLLESSYSNKDLAFQVLLTMFLAPSILFFLIAIKFLLKLNINKIIGWFILIMGILFGIATPTLLSLHGVAAISISLIVYAVFGTIFKHLVYPNHIAEQKKRK